MQGYNTPIKSTPLQQLVAHRGQSTDYPENTLESLKAAIVAGALFLEIDLQLSSDLIPILCHDATLERTAGMDIDVRTKNFGELLGYSVGEDPRLNGHFAGTRIPSLQEALALLQEYPVVQMFIELKQESFDVFGIALFVDRVLNCIAKLPSQCIVISFNHDALRYLQQQSDIRIGWIVRSLDIDTLQQAAKLNPPFMFINRLRCEGLDYDFSTDPWDWVLYESSEADEALALFDRGVSYVETNDITKLLPYFNSP